MKGLFLFQKLFTADFKRPLLPKGDYERKIERCTIVFMIFHFQRMLDPGITPRVDVPQSKTRNGCS